MREGSRLGEGGRASGHLHGAPAEVASYTGIGAARKLVTSSKFGEKVTL